MVTVFQYKFSDINAVLKLAKLIINYFNYIFVEENHLLYF